jgi:hypothetical protein
MYKNENPRSVKCPLCGAAIGYGCHTTTLFQPTGIHAARWKKIGIPTPTMQQRINAGNSGDTTDKWRMLRNIPGATRLMLGL